MGKIFDGILGAEYKINPFHKCMPFPYRHGITGHGGKEVLGKNDYLYCIVKEKSRGGPLLQFKEYIPPLATMVNGSAVGKPMTLGKNAENLKSIRSFTTGVIKDQGPSNPPGRVKLQALFLT